MTLSRAEKLDKIFGTPLFAVLLAIFCNVPVSYTHLMVTAVTIMGRLVPAMTSIFCSGRAYLHSTAVLKGEVISLLMEQLIGMTDTAFLGRVGEVELGASAIAGVFYMAVSYTHLDVYKRQGLA